MFDTYGPFTLKSHDKGGIDALYKEIDEYDPPGLSSGMGVYIVATKNEKGVPSPIYVGKTFRAFGTRLKEHFELHKFEDLSAKGPLSVFLLARAKNGRPVAAKLATERDKKLIAHLELILIGTCYKLNRDLANVQLKRFYDAFHVPGYIDHEISERDNAAKQLSKLLKTKI